MVKFLGYLNIGLLAVVLAPYLVRKLNQWFIHSKGPGFGKLMKVLRALHKPAAVLLVASVVLHGWLALGGFRLHTGTVAAVGLLLTALCGLLFYLLRKPPLLVAHRVLALVSVVLIAVHLLFPSLLSGLA